MLRPILAVLASSAIVFIWGWFSWGKFGWHEPLAFEDGAAVAEVLKANTSKHAMYSYPSWELAGEDAEAWEAQSLAGPSIYAMVRPGPGKEGAVMKSMVGGFLINVLASFALLLLIQKGAHTTVVDRVSVALLAGLFLGIVSALYPWNWMEAPGMHTLGLLVDGVVPWTLAGWAMAVILPRAAKS